VGVRTTGTFQKGHPKYGGQQKGKPRKRTLAIRAKLLADQALSVEATVESIRRGAHYDIRRLFDDTGNLRDIKKLSESDASMIAGFEIVRRNVTSGDGVQDTVLKVRLVDRARYVELAAKHLGMLTEKTEHVGEVAFRWKEKGEP
jgi:hypothetical protein